MFWFILALLGYFFLAIAFILDKFILTESVGKPVVYTFYSTIFMFGAVILFPFVGFDWLIGIDWLWALVSGLAFGFGLWTLYIAVKKGEASHINPFSGAIVTITTFILADILLGEVLTSLQTVGVFILIISSILLVFEKSKKNKGFHSGFIWAASSGVLFAVSHVSAKYLYTLYEFWPAFVWTRATTGFVALFCLLSPAVWKTFKKKKKKSKKKAKKFAIPIMVSNKIFAMLAVVLIQFAAAIGSLTLVMALAGLQYAFMFIMIVLLTMFAPKLFKEYFTRREMVIEIIAILLVVVGSALFVI